MGDTDATQEQRDVAADVDEIIEHVINANMLNMPYDVYSELFDAVDGLGVEIENLQSENAKLRELVRAAWTCIHTGASCSDCRLIAGGCTLQTAMRELRIEVDG